LIKRVIFPSVLCLTGSPFAIRRIVFTIYFAFPSDPAYPYFSDSFPHFIIGNHLAIGVFRATEVHHCWIVALFPTPRSFFADIPMTICDNVASSQQSACRAFTHILSSCSVILVSPFGRERSCADVLTNLGETKKRLLSK
jgi:hypothetical protein